MAIAALVINRPVGNCANSDEDTKKSMMLTAICLEETKNDLEEKEIMQRTFLLDCIMDGLKSCVDKFVSSLEATFVRQIHIFLCCFVFFIAVAPSFGQSKPFHVLAFYSTNVEQDHVDFALQAIPFFQEMAKRDHFEFKTTTNWDDLNPTALSDTQVVLWLDEFPSTPAQRKAFEDFMEHGGAWMGFHIAGWMENREMWPWFADFLGTVFLSNEWPPLPATLTIDDPAHPATKGLPPSYVSPDNEWYSWGPSPRKSPNIKVLMTLAPTNFPIGFKDTLGGGDIPVTWTNSKYKMIYTNMGHGDKILTSSMQNMFFENAVLWLGGREKR